MGEGRCGAFLSEGADKLFLTAVFAELYFPIRKKNYGTESGLIFFAEDARDTLRIGRILETKLEAKFLHRLGKGMECAANYQAGVHTLSRGDNPDVVVDFLHQENFLAILLVTGCMPEYLAGEGNIFFFSGKEVDGLQPDRLKEEAEGFRRTVRSSPELVTKGLEMFAGSEMLQRAEKVSMLQISLSAAAYMLQTAYRAGHDEASTKLRCGGLEREISGWARESEDAEGMEEVSDAVRSAVIRFVRDSADVMVGSIDEVDGRLSLAVSLDKGILFDRDFYFIPEALLRGACQNLLESVSFPEIKRNLWNEGHIRCNRSGTHNFTIKKAFFNVYGVCCRKRFLKFEKSFLTTWEGLCLEDVKGDNGNVLRNAGTKRLLDRQECAE